MPDPKKKTMVKVLKTKMSNDEVESAKEKKAETANPSLEEKESVKYVKTSKVNEDGTTTINVKKDYSTPRSSSPGTKAFNDAYAKAAKEGKTNVIIDGKNIAIKAATKTPGSNRTEEESLTSIKAPKADIVKPKITLTAEPANPQHKDPVYENTATRGTIGGARREGIGGRAEGSSSYNATINKNQAENTIKHNENYNKDLERKYAPNPNHSAATNAKAAQRLKELKGEVTTNVLSVPDKTARATAEALNNENKKKITLTKVGPN